MQKNPVVYWELASHDAEKSINFLKEVFDWDVKYDEEIGIYDIPAGDSRGKFAGGGVFTLKKAKLLQCTCVSSMFEKLVILYGGRSIPA